MSTPADSAKYKEIFDYLSAPDQPDNPEAAVVFGRNDPLVAYALGDLIVPGLIEVAVITGGVGKDTGDLLRQGYRSEAHFLQRHLMQDAQRRGYKLPQVLLEEKASSGGENARNSLKVLATHHVDTDSLTAVAHATSSRRLAETLAFSSEQRTGVASTVHRKPSAYSFDATNPKDREEAAAELLRLADWPAKGLLGKQPDLPLDLVDFAQDRHGDAPKPVASWQAAVLRRLPRGMQRRAIDLAARHGRK